MDTARARNTPDVVSLFTTAHTIFGYKLLGTVTRTIHPRRLFFRADIIDNRESASAERRITSMERPRPDLSKAINLVVCTPRELEKNRSGD